MALLSPLECPHLMSLDVSRCANLPARALSLLAPPPRSVQDATSRIETLRASGLGGWTDATLVRLALGVPKLRHLDLSHSSGLNDEAFESAVAADRAATGAILVDTGAGLPKWRVRLGWEVLKLSGCRELSGACLASLVGTVPHLRVLEAADLGSLDAGRGLTNLLSQGGGLAKLERLDLEGGSLLSSRVLLALRAPDGPSSGRLTHVNLSGCFSLSAASLRAFVDNTPKLKYLEADGTALGPDAVAEFVRRQREREQRGAMISALDGTAVTTRFTKEKLTKGEVRTRPGWRGAAAGAMGYFDPERDEESATVAGALFELDPGRVTVRSYAGHLAVDKADERVRKRKEKEMEEAARRAAAALARRGGGGGEAAVSSYEVEPLRGSCLVQ